MSHSSPRHGSTGALALSVKTECPAPRRAGGACDAQSICPLRWDELGAFLMTALAGALLIAVSAALAGCQRRSSNEEQGRATGEARSTQMLREATPAPRPALDPASPAAPSAGGSPGAGPADLRSFDTGKPAPGAPGERPSLGENMGRNFQGTLLMRVQGDFGSEELRYLSHGNTARLQIDTLEAKAGARKVHFDALLEGEDILVFDHQRRTLRAHRLADVQPSKAATADADANVQIHETGANLELQGAPCEEYAIRTDGLDIDACVGALPGSFDVDKLETVSGIGVPSWLSVLLKRRRLPLRVHARDGRGHERYSAELIRYDAAAVDPALLAVPPGYTRISGGSAP